MFGRGSGGRGQSGPSAVAQIAAQVRAQMAQAAPAGVPGFLPGLAGALPPNPWAVPGLPGNVPGAVGMLPSSRAVARAAADAAKASRDEEDQKLRQEVRCALHAVLPKAGLLAADAAGTAFMGLHVCSISSSQCVLQLYTSALCLLHDPRLAIRQQEHVETSYASSVYSHSHFP